MFAIPPFYASETEAHTENGEKGTDINPNFHLIPSAFGLFICLLSLNVGKKKMTKLLIQYFDWAN